MRAVLVAVLKSLVWVVRSRAALQIEVLFVLIILAHDRCEVKHFNITTKPRAQWTAQQVVEAFPWETPPRYLLRDRNGTFATRNSHA